MAEITVMRTPAEAALQQQFEAALAALPGDGAAREEAFRLFSAGGLPHRRVEEFKYTDLRAQMREAAPFSSPLGAQAERDAVAAASALKGVAQARITFVNGHLARAESSLERLPEGIEVVPLSDALTRGHPLLDLVSPVEAARENPVYQLNSAFMADGALIRVASGVAVSEPIHLAFVNVGQGAFATATRILVVLEDGASLTLLESHEGPSSVAYQLNDVLEIVLGDGASLDHVRLNAEGGQALALSTLAGRLGPHARLYALNVVSGGLMSRHQVYLGFVGDGATARVNGAAMLSGSQHADTTLNVDHAAPHGESRELFKTVVDDDATGVFQGKIVVQPHAQKTDGRMMSAALLLSEGGTMNNKPELEIFADDVQCGHGATCGQLDEDLLFYLMARGLPKAEAESLLVQAFLGEALEIVEHEGAREALVELSSDWLKSRAHALLPVR